MTPSYQVLDDKLFKSSFGGPLLRCLTRAEAERVMLELHEGTCIAHQARQGVTVAPWVRMRVVVACRAPR